MSSCRHGSGLRPRRPSSCLGGIVRVAVTESVNAQPAVCQIFVPRRWNPDLPCFLWQVNLPAWPEEPPTFLRFPHPALFLSMPF